MVGVVVICAVVIAVSVLVVVVVAVAVLSVVVGSVVLAVLGVVVLTVTGGGLLDLGSVATALGRQGKQHACGWQTSMWGWGN